MTKDEIRKIIYEKRKNITKYEVKNQSNIICKNLIVNLLPIIVAKYNSKNSINIALYKAMNNEVDLTYLDNYCQKNNFTICFPRIKKHELEFIKPSNYHKFIANNKFKQLLEPEYGYIITPDIIITPLIAFDKDLNRIGYGKGYYDKMFTKLKKDFTSIGIAYDWQKTEESINFSNYDQKLHYIVTKTKIYS